MMIFNRGIRSASGNRFQSTGKLRKIFKIFLIVLICLLSLIAIRNVIFTYHVKKNLIPDILESNKDVEQLLYVAIDGLTITTSVKNFQLHNNGAFPTTDYIVSNAEIQGLPLLLYSEDTIEIKVADDIPAEGLAGIGFPSAEQTHIWPGYVCLPDEESWLDHRYDPEVHSYADVIKPGNPSDFAMITHVTLPWFSSTFTFPVMNYTDEIRCGDVRDDNDESRASGNNDASTQSGGSFETSVNVFTSHMNDVLNDVRTGFFRIREDIFCEDDLGVIKFTLVADANNQDDCVLLGKSIQLGTDAALGISEPDGSYIVHTLIGLAAKNQNSVDEFQIFRGDSSVDFNTSLSDRVVQGDLIEKAYINDYSSDSFGIIGSDATYLDGFAVVILESGETNDNSPLDFLGGSRKIVLRAIYPKSPEAKQDSNRKRKNEDSFAEATKNHHLDPYYHELESDESMIICLLQADTGERAFVEISSFNGRLEALPDWDASRAENACGD